RLGRVLLGGLETGTRTWIGRSANGPRSVKPWRPSSDAAVRPARAPPGPAHSTAIRRAWNSVSGPDCATTIPPHGCCHRPDLTRQRSASRVRYFIAESTLSTPSWRLRTSASSGEASPSYVMRPACPERRCRVSVGRDPVDKSARRTNLWITAPIFGRSSAFDCSSGGYSTRNRSQIGTLGAQGCGGGGCGGGEGVGDAGQGGLVVRGGQEPGLERRGRQVHAAVEHGVEERGVGRRGLVLRVGERLHRRRPAQEHREQVPRFGQPERHPGRGERRGGELGHGG